MTSSNGNIFPRHWSFVRGIHRPPMNFLHKAKWRIADFFDQGLNKQFSKQSRRRWFETPLRPLCCHCNGDKAGNLHPCNTVYLVMDFCAEYFMNNASSCFLFIISDNGLSPSRRWPITWTNAGIWLIGPLGKHFIVMLIEIHTFSHKKMHLKMSSVKWRQFCVSLNVFS